MLQKSIKFKLIFTLLIVSLLMSPLTSVFAIPSPDEVWVDDDFDPGTAGFGYTHFDTIEAAVNNVNIDGTVYVAPGSYYNFYVSTPGVSVIASAGAVVDGDAMPQDLSVSGVSAGIGVAAPGVTITGFTVQNWETGIFVQSNELRSSESVRTLLEDPIISDPLYAIIDGNYLIHNGDGIVVLGQNNMVSDNTVENSNWSGIVVIGSGSTVQDNTVDQALDMGLVWGGGRLTITGNTLTNSLVGIFSEGGHDSDIHNNVCTDNYGGLVLIGTGNRVYDNIFNDNEIVGIESLTMDSVPFSATIDPVIGDTANEFLDNIITGNGGGTFPDVNVQSSPLFSISQMETGGIYCTPLNVFHGNHIADNEGYGLYVGYWSSAKDIGNGEPPMDNVDAMLNWWGHTSGPLHPETNPYASGQLISDNADYSPWLLAEPNAPHPVTTKTDYLDEEESIGIEDVVSARVAAGEGTVTVGEYSENPTDKSLFGSVGSYADVYVTSPHNIEELVVYLFYEGTPENEEELVLHWWDGSDWVACSDSGVDMEGKYVWAVITGDSIPALSDLTGTEIGAGLVVQEDIENPDEPEEELPDTGGLGFAGYGLIVMAAGFYLTKKKEA